MSRILKLFKKKKVLLEGIIGIAYLISLAYDLYKGSFFYSIIVLGILILSLLNLYVSKKIYYQAQPFSSRCTVRNVQYLLIGDLCQPDNFIPTGSTYIQIAAPGRSLKACYEILRHTFSILDEGNAHVIFVIRKKYFSKKYTLFDYPLFLLSPISVKRLGLTKDIWKLNIPIFAAPIKSLEYLINLKGHYKYPLLSLPSEITAFCKERNISLTIYTG